MQNWPYWLVAPSKEGHLVVRVALLSYTEPGRIATMASTSDDNTCRIDRRADYQGSRPPVDIQAGVEKSASGPSSSVAHQADEGEKASGRPPPPELPSPITTVFAPGNSNATDHITTLEPYEHEEQQSEWTRVTRRNRNNRRKQRKIRQVLPLFERTSTEEIFDKYYIIRFPRLPIETKINIIATDRDLKNQIGNPKKITKLNNESLLIEAQSKQQSEKISNIKTLNDQSVIVEKHKALNYVKGTLKSDALTNSTEEKILEALTPQGVIKVERMKKRENGEIKNTNRYILTFHRT